MMQTGRLIETIYPDATDTLAQFCIIYGPNKKTVTTVDWSNVIYPNGSPYLFRLIIPVLKTKYYQDGQVKANIDERGISY